MRFRIPQDIAQRIGMAELQKSLHTKDIGEARRRCRIATTWFWATMEKLRTMTSPSRTDLEAAARTIFAELAEQVDKPRSLPEEGWRQDVAYQVHLAEEHIHQLDRQLISNQFEAPVRRLAERMLALIGEALPDHLTDHSMIVAQQLAVRAARQQMVYLIHQLSTPAQRFQPDDEVFSTTDAPTYAGTSRPARDEPSRPPSAPADGGFSLADASALYLRKKKLIGLGQSQIDETDRLLGWLQQELGHDRSVATVRRDDLRKFRDDVQRIDVTLRGREAAFRDRLTNVAGNQIKSATYLRYWNAARAFFGWCHSEGYIEADPTSGLKIEKKKGETKRTPEPFTKAELLELFKTPLFAGYKSTKRVRLPGACTIREGHWWAAVLLMHTGLRAGELSQLLPEDFVFDDTVPHVKVREEDETGVRVKSTKNVASVRDVPLHPNLLSLGLKEFVQGRHQKYPKSRVFREFRLGTRGRISDGMTRFWGDYLKEFNLWRAGRSTHVWRHTVIACLRASDAAEEDIGAFVGHRGRTVTSGYGGAYPLTRKAKTGEKLDYGFDVVEALGGPLDLARHLA